MKTPSIAIFASGSGTNALNIVEYFQTIPQVQTPLLITENKNAAVLLRMQPYDIDSIHVPLSQLNSPSFIIPLLRDQYQISHIVLAGYLKLIPEFLVEAFPNKILNIHPGLLPKYGGKGMYGKHVHKAVKENQESITGISIHLVNEQFDEGDTIFQKEVPLSENDSVEDIEKKVRALEYKYFPAIIHEWCAGQI